MSQAIISDQKPFTLFMPTTANFTNDQFYEFCRANRDLRIERSAEGDLVIMPPTGGETSHQNIKLLVFLQIWTEKDGTGVAFESSGGFILPNGATRAPDAAWVKREKLTHLTAEEKKKFLPVCPDFVIELRSPSDSLNTVKEKMKEYIANGAELGWLIDPQEKTVYIYHPNGKVEYLENPTHISGEPVLRGFKLNLEKIWEASF